MSTPASDPYNLVRFIEAQDASSNYDRAVNELLHGRKQTHWMWFVFPQLIGLGSSERSQYFAIASMDEAQAYLTHPVLGARLIRCANILAALDERDPKSIFGSVDAQKLRSSVTLFSLVAADEAVFNRVLAKYFEGRLDEATLRLVN